MSNMSWSEIAVWVAGALVVLYAINVQSDQPYVESAYLGAQKLIPDNPPQTKKGQMFPSVPVTDGSFNFTNKKHPLVAPVPRTPTLKKPKMNGQPINAKKAPTVAKKPQQKLKSSEFDVTSGYLVGAPTFPMPEISEDNSRPIQPGLR